MRPDSRKIIYFTPANLGPYHIARFNHLAKAYPGLVVVGLFSPEPPRPWRSELHRLTSPFRKVGEDQAEWGLGMKIRAVLGLLAEAQPEAIILAGYTELSQWAAARWAKRRQIARILHADSWYQDHPRYFLKELIKKYFFVRPMADAAFVPGYRSYQYFHSLGLPETAIWRGLDVVDNDHFSRGAAAAQGQQSALRGQFRLPEDYFVTVTRLSPEKNILRLVQAFSSYRARGGRWQLVIVGTGPQEAQIKQLAATLAPGEVQILGWRQYEELPALYGLARCFVLASASEPWGLVVNEAMACGLPVLVSRHCGCLPELCHRGINGFDFNPLKVEELAALMLRFSGGEVDLEAMGAASRRLIANYSLDTWAQALTDCIETTVRVYQARNR